MGPVIGGRAGDDAVVVFRVALRFLETLLAAGRASVPVGKLRALIVISRDDRLGLERHLVHGTIAEVDHLFRMPEREAAIHGTTGVAGIGAGRGITFL